MKRGADETPPDDLGKYREKRDPARTNEPFEPATQPKAGRTLAGRFVVHQHAATRMHWDVRLQVGRALASFAVPRGPSLDVADKRFAVHTEAHPLEYLTFEDVIPKGNYGAGPMIAWDTGTVRYLDGSAEEGIDRGDLKIELAGHKLRGRWALVKTSGRAGAQRRSTQPEWLMIKKEDSFSRVGYDVVDAEPRSVFSGLTIEELPDRRGIGARLVAAAVAAGAPAGDVNASSLMPMLCATTDVPLVRDGWIFELKLDGVRILADKHGEEIALRYRTGRSATATYPEITRAVKALAAERVVLDGEVVAFDAEGRPSFERLGRRIHVTRAFDVQRLVADVPVVFLVFDVLAIGDRDVRSLALSERQALLRSVVPGAGLVRVLDHIEGDGRALLAFCEDHGLEGIVTKRTTSTYQSGPVRSGDWTKIRRTRDEDFVVVGLVAGKGSRGQLGSIDVASYVGERLVYRGGVGSGLDDRMIAFLEARARDLVVEGSPLEGKYARAAKRRHLRPVMVARVEFLGFTEEGHLRHPVFKGLRDDVDPRTCSAAPGQEHLERSAAHARDESADVPAHARAAEARRVQLTNQDKVFWPSDGYTKGDLCTYYAAISDTLLPFLRDRPVMLVRYPDGIDGKSFYQWNPPRGTPDWLETFEVRSEEHDGRNVSVFIMDSADALIHVANLGCIPLHVLGCRARSLDHADFMTVDFDLNGQAFRHAVTLARSLHEILEEIGLTGYPKTSGQTGLHVLIPIGEGVPWDAAKILVELIGRLLLLRHSDIATMERRVSARGPKVYIDTGQTGRSRTIVSPYSARAYPGARVSTPLAWDEVHMALDPSKFDIFTVPARVAELGDPLTGIFEQRPDVARAVARLERKIQPA